MAEQELLPRLDEIEGWPLPEQQGVWLGEPDPERELLDAYRSGRMHHAWLIGGPKGVGKATLAYRFARFVLAYSDPAAILAAASDLSLAPSHPAAQKVAAGSHPNLFSLRRAWDPKAKRFRTQLTVDEVRKLIPFFGSTAGEGGWRIAVVDRADEMNPSAANALLKMLEEPPRRALFLVLSDAPGRLLPTIRSRCRRLTLSALPQARIEAALGREGEAELADRRLAAALAAGSLRRAILLVQEDGVELYRTLAAALADLPEVNVERAYGLAERVARRENEALYEILLDLIRDWLWRRVRGLPEPNAGVGALPVPKVPSLATWAAVWEKVQQSSAEAEEYNLDRKQLIVSILMTLSRATRM